MPSEKLFVRDPREVPFLHEQVVRTLALADESSRNISIREDDDFGFMTIQFLYKQMQHAESVLLLIPRRDAGLIARSMIEGRYQLLWAFDAPEARARRWRSFSVIHDWRLIQARLKSGIPVDEADVRRTEAGLKEFGDLHRVSKPMAGSSDFYDKNWRGGVSFSKMADVVGRELYDGPYEELSDWAHWGVGGIGDSISKEDDRATVSSYSDRSAGVALLAAFQCLVEALDVANVWLSLNITDVIQALGKDFRETLDAFYQG
ncbi:MAG TPA: DUF5677 domain-containing protein [Terracidiphilus sp.]|jgi:hypothetical protein|nr:DUF5677 domain-containing protein [Terracidiphilus sp.]